MQTAVQLENELARARFRAAWRYEAVLITTGCEPGDDGGRRRWQKRLVDR